MDPEGDYESRHSTSAHVNTQEEEKAEEVYDGPTAPPLSLAGMEPNIDPSPNQKGGQDEMPLPPVATDKLAPPDETVSQSVAIPIGLDTVDAKLPEARVIPIVTDASGGPVEINSTSISMQRHGDAKIPAQSVACLKHKKLIYLVVVTAVLAFIGMAIGVAVMATKPEPGPPQPAEQTEGPTPSPTTKDYIPTVSPTKTMTKTPSSTYEGDSPTMPTMPPKPFAEPTLSPTAIPTERPVVSPKLFVVLAESPVISPTITETSIPEDLNTCESCLGAKAKDMNAVWHPLVGISGTCGRSCSTYRDSPCFTGTVYSDENCMEIREAMEKLQDRKEIPTTPEPTYELAEVPTFITPEPTVGV